MWRRRGRIRRTFAHRGISGASVAKKSCPLRRPDLRSRLRYPGSSRRPSPGWRQRGPRPAPVLPQARPGAGQRQRLQPRGIFAARGGGGAVAVCAPFDPPRATRPAAPRPTPGARSRFLRSPRSSNVPSHGPRRPRQATEAERGCAESAALVPLLSAPAWAASCAGQQTRVPREHLFLPHSLPGGAPDRPGGRKGLPRRLRGCLPSPEAARRGLPGAGPPEAATSLQGYAPLPTS